MGKVSKGHSTIASGNWAEVRFVECFIRNRIWWNRNSLVYFFLLSLEYPFARPLITRYLTPLLRSKCVSKEHVCKMKPQKYAYSFSCSTIWLILCLNSTSFNQMQCILCPRDFHLMLMHLILFILCDFMMCNSDVRKYYIWWWHNRGWCTHRNKSFVWRIDGFSTRNPQKRWKSVKKRYKRSSYGLRNLICGLRYMIIWHAISRERIFRYSRWLGSVEIRLLFLSNHFVVPSNFMSNEIEKCIHLHPTDWFDEQIYAPDERNHHAFKFAFWKSLGTFSELKTWSKSKR